MKKIGVLLLLLLIVTLSACDSVSTTCPVGEHLSGSSCVVDVTTTTTTKPIIDTNNVLSLNVGNSDGWTFYSNYKSTPQFSVANGVLSFLQMDHDEDWNESTTWSRKMTYNQLSFEEGTTYTIEFNVSGSVGETYTIQIYDSLASLIVEESFTLDGSMQTKSLSFTPSTTADGNGILVIGLGTFENNSSIEISNLSLNSEVIVNEEISVLFIGNSFTYYNNMPTILSLMASTSGYLVHVEQITYGGYQLSEYVQIGAPETQEVIDKINEREWDYVILQEQSSKPATDKVGFIQAVGQLNQLIESNGAKTILYSTWSYRDGSTKLASTGYTYTEFYQVLTNAYLEASTTYHTMVAPVGTVFYNLTMNQPTINLLDYADDFHPTIEGSYVAAYTFYLMIFGSEKDNTYRPSQLTLSKTTILDQYVEEVLGIE